MRLFLHLYRRWRKKKGEKEWRERKLFLAPTSFQLSVSFRSMFTIHCGSILICLHWNEVTGSRLHIVFRCAIWGWTIDVPSDYHFYPSNMTSNCRALVVLIRLRWFHKPKDNFEFGSITQAAQCKWPICCCFSGCSSLSDLAIPQFNARRGWVNFNSLLSRKWD